jgi:hypothetical protein
MPQIEAAPRAFRLLPWPKPALLLALAGITEEKCV